jgi:hypothetical protein
VRLPAKGDNYFGPLAGGLENPAFATTTAISRSSAMGDKAVTSFVETVMEQY